MAIVLLLFALGSASAIASAPSETGAAIPDSGPGAETISNKCSAYGTVCVHATAVVTEVTCLLGWCKFAETGAGGGTNGLLKLPAHFWWNARGGWLSYFDQCSVAGWNGVGVLGEITGCGDTKTAQTGWLSKGDCTRVVTNSKGQSKLLGTTFEEVSVSATAQDCN